LNPEQTIIAVIDCSFLRKSGKKTEGKAYFYNSIAGHAQQGLEISVISIVEVYTHLSISLTVQQTPSRPQTELPKTTRAPTKKKLVKNQRKKQVAETSYPDITIVDDYAKHLKYTRFFFPNSVRYLVAYGYYYRSKFWETVRELN
jgi:hypothetical protein